MTGGADPSAGAAGTYVFGVARGLPGSLGPELPRLPGSGPVRTIRRGDLDLIVCDADAAAVASLSDDDPDGLERLAAFATTHDQVLVALCGEAPLIPLQLGTVLPDDAAAADLLERSAPLLHEQLDRFEGRNEWAVTVRLADREDGGEEPRTEATDGGAAYLRRRQAELDAKRDRAAERRRVVADIHDRLAAHATEVDTVDPSRTTVGAPRHHHGVYLVADDGLPAFEEEIAALRTAHPGTTIEVAGPLPPYHFTSVRLDADRAEDGTAT